METRVGTHLDRYEIDAELGHGAMGVVYRARDPKLHRTVAIKTVSLSNLDSESEQEFRKRFVIEAQAAGRLSHPGIVTIFDVRETPEPFLVMEYVEGQSLQQLLRGETRLPLSTSLRLVQEVAEALHYAHAQGVVHRDIKPANILVTPEGHPKIADFGVAKLNQTDLTLPGQVFGSPAFMAPEQLTEEGSDARSDLFSLGVILYYTLTGHRPFQGNSTATVCFKLVNHEPVPVSAFDSKFSPELDRIVSRAMAKDPAKRYQSGMAMASDLQDLRERSGFVHRDSSTGLRNTAPMDTLQAVPVERAPKPIWASLARAVLLIAVLAIMVMAVALRGKHNSRYEAADSPKAEVPMVHRPLSTNASQDQGVALKQAATRPSSAERRSPSPEKRTPNNSPASRPKHLADATLQIEVEHHFTDARASVWLDNDLVYTKSLHGEKQRRALLFQRVSGRQFDVIQVPSGTHQVRVRVHSAGDSYDQSKIMPGASIRGASLLRITCGGKGEGLQLSLHKGLNQ